MKGFKRLAYLLSFLLIGMLMPLSILVAGGVALRQRRKQMIEAKPMSCRSDVECPPGFLCNDGRCVPAD